MPHIKAFKALIPNSHFANKVAVYVENLSIEDAKTIRAANDKSFVHLLVPKLDSYFMQGSKQELAFKKIAENLEDFIANEVLIQDKDESIYIYKVRTKDYEQTGIWALTAVKDYQENKVKKHELTRADREENLSNYMLQTGIDANPVLITYSPQPLIEEVLAKVTSGLADLSFDLDQTFHSLWRVYDKETIATLIQAFEQMPTAYIADGHHRAAAACKLAELKKSINPEHTGLEEYNFFNSLYISAEQLNILEYNRLIKETNLSEQEVLQLLEQKFNIEKIAVHQLKPQEKGEFGFLFYQKAYRLTLKTAKNLPEVLDVNTLQDLILNPIFQIAEPKTDINISFIAGNVAYQNIIEMIKKGEYIAAFFLFPTAINEIMQVANAGETMPPKSTWFEPKLPIGLVTHFVN